ncbi:hypothetical protein NBRC111894_952 [Sporolactobacillus inulinus]|uniref:Uncharacterized protein n=1 Tax=Sporolactobacillus inulinus TaxID=2078 RepID=A0A4Y1Z949_9BACL|nr:hypothetical protein NBRC111894_952 [Sporolactobacillus inulinus]
MQKTVHQRGGALAPAASEQSERTQKPGWFKDQAQLGCV